MPPINILIKPASGLCNMSCDYCFYCDETKKREQECYGIMSEKTLKHVIRKTLFSAEAFCTIAFQGGEPTLCGIDFFQNVIKYVQKYNKNNVHIEYALQTNGFCITEEWCRFFADNHFLIGVSVDGISTTHDKYRHCRSNGQGTYEQIMKTIAMFERYNVSYNVLTVVHKDTAENINKIYKKYRKHGWDYMQFITCLDPIGEERGKQEYSLLPEMYGEFLIKLFDLWYMDYKRNDQPFIRQFENYIAILLGYLPESCDQRGVCGIQNVIEADGSVYPCDFYALDDYCLGNLNDVSMEEIYKKRDEIEFVKRSLNHPEQCKKCKWFSLCRGGCYRSRLSENENQDGLNYFCKGYQMFFEKCYDRLQEIAQDVVRRKNNSSINKN